MSGFSLDWLSLREPYDLAARASFLDGFDRAGLIGEAGLQVMDLGCGSGANLRALAPRLGHGQQWLLVDRDEDLLQGVADRCRAWAAGASADEQLRVEAGQDGLRLCGVTWDAQVRCHAADLSSDLALQDLPWPRTGLLTASALLDLVSGRWLDRLLALAGQARCALLFSLSVDGRLAFEPKLDGDARVLDLFARHQQRDKGFGPALGSAAVPRVAAWAEARGWRVAQATSDWTIDARPGAHSPPHARAAQMLLAMIDGIAQAACEVAGGSCESAESAESCELGEACESHGAQAVRAWHEARAARLPDSRLLVGHLELMAWPDQGDAALRRSRSHITSGAIE